MCVLGCQALVSTIYGVQNTKYTQKYLHLRNTEYGVRSTWNAFVHNNTLQFGLKRIKELGILPISQIKEPTKN